ncbi:8680_t:CDS:2, partial [Gigaspora margarita]
YSFISRQTFDNLVNQYIESLASSKKEKALINQEKLQKIKDVLLNPTNTTLYTSTFRYWVKNKFKLQQIGGSYIVLHIRHKVKRISIELPVLVVENMYDEFCKIHATVTQHAGQKETWNQLTQVRPLAGIPIIERKFIVTITTVEVAAFLLKIFTTFGPPLILQSDNGKEFVSSVIVELVNLWPMIQIINDRPRHPASQGLVERANGILEIKLGKWMEDNNRQDWSFGLRFVIYAMNNSICRAHNKKPYALVFGVTPHAALDHLFETNISSEDEIPDEFGLENIQEPINDLDDLIDNTLIRVLK